MQKLILNIADHKLQTFLAFIKDLNYVEVIATSSSDEAIKPPSEETPSDDFIALAGMWEGKDISAEEIRSKAWPTRN